MADNYTFTPGAGASGASDDIGGVHYPRVKVAWGTDGTASDAAVANPLPVQDQSPPFSAGAGVGGTTVGTASTQICAQNTNRKLVAIFNGGTVGVWIRAGTPGTVGTGGYLAANGGYVEWSYTGVVAGVASVGSATVGYQEF